MYSELITEEAKRGKRNGLMVITIPLFMAPWPASIKICDILLTGLILLFAERYWQLGNGRKPSGPSAEQNMESRKLVQV